MNAKLYIMGAAAAALLTAGAAQAASSRSGGAYAEPSQPVAYSKLNAYMKASPSKRMKGDWTNTAAASGSGAMTGTASDTAATMPPTAPMANAPMSNAPMNSAPASSDQPAPMTNSPGDMTTTQAPSSDMSPAQDSTTGSPSGTAVNPPATK